MQGTSLVGQRLKLHAPNARDLVTPLVMELESAYPN